MQAQAPQTATPGVLIEAFGRASHQRVVGADGVPIEVVEQGDRASPAIVFIHGYRQSHLSWFAQFGSTLSSHCHLIAYDLRGHGDSGAPWSPDAYTRSAVWAIDLANVMEATGARRPMLVAWSFGGLVAMDYLRDIGDDIAGLVLVGTAGRLIPAQTMPVNTSEPPMLATRASTAQASADAVYGPRIDPQVRSMLAAASLRTGPFIDAAMIVRTATLDNADLVPKVRGLPVVLVRGSDDPIVPRSDIARLSALLPAARVVEFPGSGHAPFADASERFDALLETHCRR